MPSSGVALRLGIFGTNVEEIMTQCEPEDLEYSTIYLISLSILQMFLAVKVK